MRYPDGHKEQMREKIVAEASRALREGGLEGVSIAALMKRVGLTHGGFYSHFANRDELVAAAVRAAAEETAASLFEGGGAGLDAVLSGYLSPAHVEGRARGCVVATLGAEGARHGAPVADAFAYASRGLIGLVDDAIGAPEPAQRPAEPSDAALETTARMLGAVLLARLVDDPELGERILAVNRQASSNRG
jgi:TetR/AcrR family transcriptional repressor of nem operon